MAKVVENPPVAPVTCEISVCGDKALVTCRVPEPEARGPVDVVCVVDVSGSMGTNATYEVGDEIKDDGLTVLDVTKHAVRTILAALHDQDKVALVAFDHNAETVLPLTALAGDGRALAEASLDALQPQGQTNLWGGLLHGMDALREGFEPPDEGERGRLQTVLLFTDGQPNIKPPRGHLHELQTYRETHPDFQCQICTFGFGYSLDSELLLQLAGEGAGSFAFIPAAPMVGTALVDSLANVLSNHTPRAALHLSSKGGEIGEVRGFNATAASWGRVVDLGPLQFGQEREVVVCLAPGAQLEAVLEYGEERAFARDAPLAAGQLDAADLRCSAIHALDLAVQLGRKNQLDEALGKLAAVADRCRELQDQAGGPAKAQLVGLEQDMRGRATKALTGKPRFQRWGRHYLRALSRAHALQWCTNFVDPGVQGYARPFFAQLRAEGDRLFVALPPPQPAQPMCPLCSRVFTKETIVAHAQRCGQAVAAPPQRAAPARSCAAAAAAPKAVKSLQPAVDMNHYYDRFSGCFGPTTTVLVNGTVTPIAAVRPGDVVATRDGHATVRCVVRSAEPVPLVQVPGGPCVTPTHPVFAGRWAPPQGHAAGEDCVWNLVLTGGDPAVLADGLPCATLGHGLDEDGCRHAYYGTGRVLEDLAQLPGWDEGLVTVLKCVRNESGRVCGLAGPGTPVPAA